LLTALLTHLAQPERRGRVGGAELELERIGVESGIGRKGGGAVEIAAALVSIT